MHRHRIAAIVGLAVAACGGGGGGGDDTATPDGAGDDTGGDGPGGGGLTLLYEGPVAGAAVPGWSAAAPRPVIVEALLSASSTWWISIARIAPGGQVSEIVADELRIWGWSGGADAPAELASGPLATTRVPGWSSATPRPLVLGARQDGSQDWFVAIAKVAADGSLSELVADDVMIWGWPAGSGPTQEYDGPLATASVSPWSVTGPRPLIALANQSQPAWYVSLAGVSADGAVGGIVADTIELWGF